MLSSYFDLRARRNQEQRQEERRQDERRQDEERRRQDEERRQEERRRDEELNRQSEERRRQDEERRRQDEERRHREMMALLAAVLSNGREQGNSQTQSELVQSLRQTIEALEIENASLRRQNGDSDASHAP